MEVVFPQGGVDLWGMLERYKFKVTAFVKRSITGMGDAGFSLLELGREGREGHGPREGNRRGLSTLL